VIHCLGNSLSWKCGFLPFSFLSPSDFFCIPTLFAILRRCGVVCATLLANVFRQGNQSKRKSEGEEEGRRKEKKTRKRGIPISVNASVSLPLNFAVLVQYQ